MVLISGCDGQRPALMIPGKKVDVTLHVYAADRCLGIGHAENAGNVDIHGRDAVGWEVIIRTHLSGLCGRCCGAIRDDGLLGRQELQTALRRIERRPGGNICTLSPREGDFHSSFLASSANHTDLRRIFIDVLAGGLIRKGHVKQARELLVHLEQLISRYAHQRICVGSFSDADVNSFGRQVREHARFDAFRRQLVIRRCRSHRWSPPHRSLSI